MSADGWDDLNAHLDHLDDFGAEADIYIDAVTTPEPGQVVVAVTVEPGYDDGGPATASTRWRVLADGVVDTRLRVGSAHWDVELSTVDPVVGLYGETSSDLYFRGPVTDPSALLGDLWVAYENEYGNSWPLSTFINRYVDEPQVLLSRGGGMLLRGPREVVEFLQRWLEDRGVAVSRMDARIGGATDSAQEPRPARSLVMLSLEGEAPFPRDAPPVWSFIVAESFRIERMDAQADDERSAEEADRE